jgi:3-isopropylmalate/(R)-2-methylmalate dehydratase small subunit
MTKIVSKALSMGDNVDTDMILPARYLMITDESELASHAFEDMKPEFRKKFETNKIIVAGRNFGCGSSREHAPIALRKAGIKAIIAESYARIFYRNAINQGMIVLEAENVSNLVRDGDDIEVDLDTFKVVNTTKGVALPVREVPKFMAEILKAGGLVNYLRDHKDEW